MSLSSLVLRLRRRPNPLPATLVAARSMGGGPRTFPGGLNKWQYKRMHEKLAKEKERKLLHQEKQLYQARLRSEIRAKVASGGSGNQSLPSDPSNFTAMSSKAHIKALADRFMKQGAEDLWNEDDGPISERKTESEAKPLDLKNIEKGARSSIGKLGSFEQRREYSRWRRNLLSDDEDLDRGGLIRKELKISKFVNGKEEDEENKERDFESQRRKKMMSGAALRNFDGKKEKRAPRGDDEEESDLLEQIRGIREEIRNRESFGNGKKHHEVKEGSVLTQKRFDECNISSLTIKALNSAGYVQMTVVQEAALPVCLEGKDALVKARTGTGKSAAFLF